PHVRQQQVRRKCRWRRDHQRSPESQVSALREVQSLSGGESAMNSRSALIIRAVGLVVLSALAASPATAALAIRTWVSGVDDDLNQCSRTAPCKTFAGAIPKTAAGGVIDALDPEEYGGKAGSRAGGEITKDITING